MEDFFQPIKLAGDILDKRSNDGLSFRELSELIGIDKMKLYRMECGDKATPVLNDFYIICQWLQKPMDNYFLKPKTKTNGKSSKLNHNQAGRKTGKK